MCRGSDSKHPRSCLDFNIIRKPRNLQQWLGEPDAARVPDFDKFRPNHRALKHALSHCSHWPCRRPFPQLWLTPQIRSGQGRIALTSSPCSRLLHLDVGKPLCVRHECTESAPWYPLDNADIPEQAQNLRKYHFYAITNAPFSTHEVTRKLYMNWPIKETCMRSGRNEVREIRTHHLGNAVSYVRRVPLFHGSTSEALAHF